MRFVRCITRALTYLAPCSLWVRHIAQLHLTKERMLPQFLGEPAVKIGIKRVTATIAGDDHCAELAGRHDQGA